MSIAHRYLCHRLLLPDMTVCPDAVLDVDDSGRIGYAGSAAGAGPSIAPTTSLAGLVMPGLVNTHCHTPMTIIRSAGDGLNLHDWLNTEIWPREGRLTPEHVYWGQALGMGEMLRSGITTTCEMYLFEDPVIEATRDSGARLVTTPGMIDALHGDDFAGRVQELVDLHSKWHNPAGGVSIGFGPHSPYTLTPEHLKMVADAAIELDTLFNIHLEETEAERDAVIEVHGKTATQLLADLGALDAKVLAAHGVWLGEEDLQLLGQAGAAVTHCPASNLKLGSGFADVRAWKDAGVVAALGTDGPASNDSLDLWYEMKLAPGLARGLHRDPGALSTIDAFAMATVEGAKALGLGDVGALEVGYHADFINVDLNDPALQPALNDAELITHLVFSGSGRAVTDVWVAGRQVVSDGVPTMIDPDQVTSEFRRLAPTLLP